MNCKKCYRLSNSLFLGLIICFIWGCSSVKPYQFEPMEEPISVETKNFIIEPDSLNYSFKGIEISFPGKVNKVDYDFRANALAVNHLNEDESISILSYYDLETRNIKWMGEGYPNTDINILKNDVVSLHSAGGQYGYTRKALLNGINGNFIRETEPGLFVVNDELSLTTYGRKIRRIDLQTGTELWRIRGRFSKGHTWEYYDRESGMFLLVTNGIYAFNPETGEGWSHKISTSHVEPLSAFIVAGVFALNVAAAAVGVADRVPNQPLRRIHNICSRPVVIRDKVFFAARKKIYCFDKATGELLWKSKIDKEYGVLNIGQISSQEIVVYAAGYKYRDLNMIRGKGLSIYTFSIENGAIKNKIHLEDRDLFMDIDFRENSVFLMKPYTLYKFDSNLNYLSKYESKEILIDIIPRSLTATDSSINPPITVRSSIGFIEIDPSLNYPPAGFNLSQPIETLNEDFSEFLYGDYSWRLPLLVKQEEGRRRLMEEEDDIFLFTGKNGLVDISFKDGIKINSEISLEGNQFFFDEEDNSLIEIFENKVRLLKIVKNN